MQRRSKRATLLVLFALVVAACAPVLSPIDSSYQGAFLTGDNGDAFGLSINAAGQTVATGASANANLNSRVAFWDANAPARSDSEACATWDSESQALNQEGLAFHVTDNAGVVRAVTVTKNIWAGLTWTFNFHVWDSSQNPAFTMFGGATLNSMYLVPFPWRICARVVGTTFSFVVWPTTMAQPAWDDPAYGGSATIPVGWQNPGETGWYFGHLAANDSITYSDLTTSP